MCSMVRLRYPWLFVSLEFDKVFVVSCTLCEGSDQNQGKEDEEFAAVRREFRCYRAKLKQCRALRVPRSVRMSRKCTIQPLGRAAPTTNYTEPLDDDGHSQGHKRHDASDVRRGCPQGRTVTSRCRGRSSSRRGGRSSSRRGGRRCCCESRTARS